MAAWIQIGETKFNLDAVTALYHPKRDDPSVLEVYVSGRSKPFLLHTEEAASMWEAIQAHNPMGPGPRITSIG